MMQVVSLRAPCIDSLGLCTWPSMRHLQLHTSTLGFLTMDDLQAFTQLKSLRLHHCASEFNSDCQAHLFSEDLNLSSLQSLRRLHIEDWSPRSSISVTAGCRVDVLWRLPLTCEDLLLGPCWQSPGTALASLQVNAGSSMLGPAQTQAIQKTLKYQTGLELLRITSATLGSKEVPLTFPRERSECLRALLRIEICTTQGCWIDEKSFPFRNQSGDQDRRTYIWKGTRCL